MAVALGAGWLSAWSAPILPLGSGLMSNISSKVQQWKRIVWDGFSCLFALRRDGVPVAES